jgi:signal transduction histidine kinase
MCLPLDPARDGGLTWAVSLWSERGLIGVLLLGAKRDGGLYTQEEIEIARASGERLIDTLATAQVSGRLMALLRQRIAQVRVMEGQGRRVLHDQILPRLHTAILHLGGLPDEPAAQQAVEALAAAHRQISDLMHDTAPAAPHLLSQQGLIDALRASVETEFAGEFDRVEWHSSPEAVQAAERLPLYVSEVLFFAAQELIRNAARHGRGDDPERPLHLEVVLDVTSLSVEDDGVGFRTAPPPLQPAEAVAEGRNGLRFHSTMLAAVGGSLEVAALPGKGTRAVVRFPQP